MSLIKKKKRWRAQITNIRNESLIITIAPMGLKGNKRILWKILGPQIDGSDKMGQFLEGHRLSKLTQGEIGNLNRSVSIKTESIIWKLIIKK